jgi:hypothetical protein
MTRTVLDAVAPGGGRPPRRPPPATKKLRAPACGIMFVPHIMPPAPQDSRSDAARKRFGNVIRVVHIGGSRGHLRALRRQVLSSSFPALPRSCLTCAAWSFLRDHLTPRPAVFTGFAKHWQRSGGVATIPRVPGEVGWASMTQAVIRWRAVSVASIRREHQPQPSPALGRSGAGCRKIAHPTPHGPTLDQKS